MKLRWERLNMSNAERRPVVNANSSRIKTWLFIHVCNSLSIDAFTVSKQLDKPEVVSCVASQCSIDFFA
jgi:hypothetical protein